MIGHLKNELWMRPQMFLSSSAIIVLWVVSFCTHAASGVNASEPGTPSASRSSGFAESGMTRLPPVAPNRISAPNDSALPNIRHMNRLATRAQAGVEPRRVAPLSPLFSEVVQASYGEDTQTSPESVLPPPATNKVPVDLISMPPDAYAIDLTTTLQLAGANSLQVAIARARIGEAQALFSQARVLWVPSLQAGVGYNRHDGRIQDTQGQVIEVDRSSVYVGGGAAASGFPLTGASNGPARLAIGVSLADALFEPLATRQTVRREQADSQTAFNDSQLAAAAAYLALTEAYAQLAIAKQSIEYAEELVRITTEFAQAGRGLQADVGRAQAELARRQQDMYRAKERVGVVSAELVRQLRLDPTVILFPLEIPVARLDLIDTSWPLNELIAQATGARPELRRERAFLNETFARTRQERWRPLLPNLYAGVSGGGFGGGAGSFVGNFSDRVDFDALAVWEIRNLGLGTRALRAGAVSRNTQAQFLLAQTRDRVAADVAGAYREVESRRGQINAAGDQMDAAARALPLNFQGIEGGALRPIEAQQAIAALADGQMAFVAALVGYNQSQFALLRAIGDFPAVETTDVPIETISNESTDRRRPETNQNDVP